MKVNNEIAMFHCTIPSSFSLPRSKLFHNKILILSTFTVICMALPLAKRKRCREFKSMSLSRLLL